MNRQRIVDITEAYYSMLTRTFKKDGIHFYLRPTDFHEERVLFQTLVPHDSALSYPDGSLTSRLKAVRCLQIRCYERLARYSLKNWRRKHVDRLPVTIAFIEPLGARARNKHGLDLRDLPHLHSMTYFRSRASALKFAAALADGSFDECLSRDRVLKSSKHEFYDRRKGSLPNLFAYCAKFAVEEQAKPQNTEDLIMYLPLKSL